MKIPIVNPSIYLAEKTYLSADYQSGTSLSVKNSDKFSDNDIIILGEPGQERTESTDLTATPPNVTTLTVAALSFSHPKDTPVYKVGWDQVTVEKSTDGSSYSVLATVDLNFEKTVTIYEDTTGATTDYYRVKLKNSATGNVSGYSDVQLGSGWPRNSVGRMVRNVKRGLRDLETGNYDDWEIMEELINAKDEVASEIPNAWWTRRSSDRTTTASTASYYLPIDYRMMEFLIYQYNPDDSETENKKYPLKYIPHHKWLHLTSDQTQDDDDYLDSWTELPGDSDYPNGYFGLWPTPESTGESMTLWYFRDEPTFDSFGDVTDCPLPQVYENYAIAALTQDADVRALYEGKYLNGLRQLKLRQKRNTQPYSLRNWGKRDPVRTFYGREAQGRTQADKENYW